MLADIPTSPVFDFPCQILQSNEKGVGNLQRVRHLDSLQAGSSIENAAHSKHPLPLKMAGGRNIKA